MNTDDKKSRLDTVGGWADSMLLSVSSLANVMRRKRAIDRETYEEQVDFYIDHGYADDPASFFTLPQEAPGAHMVLETPYLDGVYQLLSYPSTYKTVSPLIRDRFDSYAANKTAYLARWTHGDRGRKTVLCLHGFSFGDPKRAEKMFKVRNLFHMGLDVAQFVVPFHWERSPESFSSGRLYLQPDDVAMTCECMGQTMHDLFAAFLLLKDMGADEIGTIGASMGGYHGSLFACLTDLPAFAAMMVPAINFSRPMGADSARLPFEVEPDFSEKIGRVWEFHSPLNLLPKIPKDRILFIASRGDKLCPFEFVKLICERWGGPRHQFMTGGHWLIFDRTTRGSAWYRFLADMGFIPRKEEPSLLSIQK